MKPIVVSPYSPPSDPSSYFLSELLSECHWGYYFEIHHVSLGPLSLTLPHHPALCSYIR